VDGDAAPTLDADGGPPDMAPRRWPLGHTCDPLNVGKPERSDNCDDGLICVQGDKDAICFATCTTPGLATECNGTSCETRDLDPGGPMVNVCGQAAVPCDPVTKTGCDINRTCYLSGSSTICDISSGELRPPQACSFPRDCLPGLTCAAGHCRVVCAASTTCPVGSTCQTEADALFGSCL
jgi:hypothetical protein